MNEGEPFDGVELPEIEVVDIPKEEEEVDLSGQIKALENQIEALEAQYDESNTAKIEALKRQKMELEEKLKGGE